MNDVLYSLCRHCVSIWGGWVPYPSTVIAESLGISLYKARKELKALKEQGLVIANRYCERTEYSNILVNGYTITEKAKETDEYKTAFAKEKELCKEIFGIDI